MASLATASALDGKPTLHSVFWLPSSSSLLAFLVYMSSTISAHLSSPIAVLVAVIDGTVVLIKVVLFSYESPQSMLSSPGTYMLLDTLNLNFVMIVPTSSADFLFGSDHKFWIYTQSIYNLFNHDFTYTMTSLLAKFLC